MRGDVMKGVGSGGVRGLKPGVAVVDVVIVLCRVVHRVIIEAWVDR